MKRLPYRMEIRYGDHLEIWRAGSQHELIALIRTAVKTRIVPGTVVTYARYPDGSIAELVWDDLKASNKSHRLTFCVESDSLPLEQSPKRAH